MAPTTEKQTAALTGQLAPLLPSARPQSGATEAICRSPGPPALLLIEPDDSRASRLERFLGEEFALLGRAANAATGLQLVRQLQPQVVVINLRLPESSGLDVVRQISKDHPGVLIAVLSADRSVEALRLAMRAGAREFLVQGTPMPEVLSCLQRLVERETSTQASKNLVSRRPPGAGIWCFANPTGGAGQTTLLLALADGLRLQGRRVAVVDLDLFFGDVPFYLNMQRGEPNLGNLLSDFPSGYFPPARLPQYAQRHKSGLDVFFGPEDLTEAAEVALPRLIPAIYGLREQYDYVLVDLPSGLADATLPLLDQARYVFAVGDNRLSGLKNMSNFLDLLYKIRCEPSKVHPVLTHLRPGGLEGERFFDTLKRLGTESFHEIPCDLIHAEDAVLGGEPVTGRSPESPYAQAAERLLLDLLGFHAKESEPVTKPPVSLAKMLRSRVAGLFA